MIELCRSLIGMNQEIAMSNNTYHIVQKYTMNIDMADKVMKAKLEMITINIFKKIAN